MDHSTAPLIAGQAIHDPALPRRVFVVVAYAGPRFQYGLWHDLLAQMVGKRSASTPPRGSRW